MEYQNIRNKLKEYKIIGLLEKDFKLNQKKTILKRKLKQIDRTTKKPKTKARVYNFLVEYNVKEVYHNGNKEYITTRSHVKQVKANNKKTAVKQLKQYYQTQEVLEDSNRTEIIETMNNYKMMSESSYNNKMLSKIHHPMKSATVYKPEFLKHCKGISESSYKDHKNECVYSLILNYYKDQIKRLTKEKLFNIFEKVKNAEYNMKYMDGVLNPFQKFDYKSGVSSKMILHFCELYDISCWGYDENDQQFISHASRNKLFRPLAFYCVNDHFYLIDDKKTRDYMIKSSTSKRLANDFTFLKDDKEELEIVDYNLSLEDVLKLEKGRVLYDKDDLQDELIKYFKIYKTLPYKVENRNYGSVSKIWINKSIIMEIVNSLTDHIQKEEIMTICDDNNIKYNNQSFGGIVYELKDRYYNKRKFLTQDEKSSILNKQCNKCNICSKNKKKYEYDHIEPFIINYNNNLNNFQALCIDCHREKTAKESEDGSYISFDKLKSYYNKQTREIMDGKYMKRWAFIDQLPNITQPKGYEAYKIDINKCRRNILLNSKYDLPIFSCLDGVKVYNGEKLETGFYYVETSNYFPLRGNKFYSLPMVEYCLKEGIIKIEDIKYAWTASCSLKAGYYKSFFNNCNIKDKKKAFNTLIGCFNKDKQFYYNSYYTSSIYDASNKWFGRKNSKIWEVEDLGLYQVVSEQETKMNNDSRPFYNQILDIEAIQLHQMSKMIKKEGGIISELNTDAILYYCDHKIEIDLYKYKYEIPRKLIQGSKSFEKEEDHYIFDDWKWEEVDEIDDKSVNILGRAGTGKSYIINKFVEKVGVDNCVILTPTNKSASIIGGKTIHHWARSCFNNDKLLKRKLNKIKFIIVDEVSMLKEIYYSLLLYIKSISKIKFIIVGDYNQLEPVNDRIKKNTEYYKNSRALYDICDGRRMVLTECRRSGDELFNICKDVKNIDVKKFKNKYAERQFMLNLCYTNKKVNEINKECNLNYVKDDFLDVNGMRIKKNVPLIGIINDNETNIIKNVEYVVSKYNKSKVYLKSGESVLIKDFKKFFVLGYAMTIHKSQGSTFAKNYLIHEYSKLDDTLKYVALSRAKNIKQINIKE